MNSINQQLKLQKTLQLLQERNRSLRSEEQNTQLEQTLLSNLFSKQKQVIQDSSKRKCLRTSRRAGKSFLCCYYLILQALEHSDARCLYLTDTREHAKRLIWSHLQELDKQYSLDMEFNNSDLIARFPDNNSEIWLSGAPDDTVAQRLRGFYWHLAVIDEAQSIGEELLEPLVKEVLGPGLRDYDGTLVLAGTPCASCTGYFHEVDTNKENKYNSFSRYYWTALDNPEFPIWAGKQHWQEEAIELYEQWRLDEGYLETDPGYLREYWGLWKESKGAKVFYLTEDNNAHSNPGVVGHLPGVLGIDLGFIDEAAFILNKYDQRQQILYQYMEESYKELSLTQLKEVTDDIIETYNPEVIVIDPAAGGKHLVKEISVRYDIPCLASEKKEKASLFRLARADLFASRIKILQDSKLWKQLNNLKWDKSYQRELESCKCDLVDAWIYSYRYCHHHIFSIPISDPDNLDNLPGSIITDSVTDSDPTAAKLFKQQQEELKQQQELQDLLGLSDNDLLDSI